MSKIQGDRTGYVKEHSGVSSAYGILRIIRDTQMAINFDCMNGESVLGVLCIYKLNLDPRLWKK